VRFAFISEEKVAFPYRDPLPCLGRFASGYYASQNGPPHCNARRDQDLSERIASITTGADDDMAVPGSCRPKASGDRVGCKRVARLMRENKLVARCRRRFRTTTTRSTASPSRRMCWSATSPRFVPTSRGSLTSRFWDAARLAVPRSHSRPVFQAGCRLGDQSECRSPPCARGAGHGLRQRRPGSGLVHHSDRGSTYASDDYRKA